MQTFLPVPSFVGSMEYLDPIRLSKQRIEAAQILEILLDVSIIPDPLKSVVPFDRHFSAWTRHPVVLMWRGHEEWLKLYMACAIGEFEYRGHENKLRKLSYNTESQPAPAWLGYEPFHRSHRSNLIRRYPTHYKNFWPEEDASLSYFWPTLNGFSVSDPQNILSDNVSQGERSEQADQTVDNSNSYTGASS